MRAVLVQVILLVILPLILHRIAAQPWVAPMLRHLYGPPADKPR